MVADGGDRHSYGIRQAGAVDPNTVAVCDVNLLVGIVGERGATNIVPPILANP